MSLPRTPMMLAHLVKAVCENHGDLLSACGELQVSYRHVCLWLQADPEAAGEVKNAQMIGWASLENAAYRRGVHGVEKGVYFKGEKVDTETQYSDTLLSQMLKARVPGYGDTPATTGMTVNVAIMPRANTYEEWIQQRETALSSSPAEQVITVQPKMDDRVQNGQLQVLENKGDGNEPGISRVLVGYEPTPRISAVFDEPDRLAPSSLRDVL
jgi:hypothetical protein